LHIAVIEADTDTDIAVGARKMKGATGVESIQPPREGLYHINALPFHEKVDIVSGTDIDVDPKKTV
jgi:hypothetical protein